MLLTNSELDKLNVSLVAMVAERRRARGTKLNLPEAMALIQDHILEGARDGKTVAQLQDSAAKVLRRSDVLDGVQALVGRITVQATFADGLHTVSVADPIK
jgi:urease subunit gamma